MKNTLTKILTLLLALVCSLTLLVGCDATVDEDAFRKALTDALSNVTMDVEYTGDGMSYNRTVRTVNGRTYLKGDDGKWVETTSENTLVLVIGAIAKHYDAFTFEDGAYQAGSLHLVDAEEHYTDVDNVKITFDLTGNAKSISFDEMSANGNVGTHVIKLSSHGKTTPPDDITSSDKNSSGTVTDDGASDDFDSSNSFKPDNGAADGGSISPDGTFVPGDSSTGEVTLGHAIDAKKWLTAFNLESSNFSARLEATSPSGEFICHYRVADGLAYYSDDGISWTSGGVENFTDNVLPFRDLFDSFYYNGYAYCCGQMEINGATVIDVYVAFDSENRLASILYTLVLDGESGITQIVLYDYDVTVVPGVDADNSQNSSGSDYTNPDDDNFDKTEHNFSK